MGDYKEAGCVFGPANGQWVRYVSDYYRHRLLTFMPPSPHLDEYLPTEPTADVFVYREFYFGTRKILVPADWTNERVMDSLMRYAITGWKHRGDGEE